MAHAIIAKLAAQDWSAVELAHALSQEGLKSAAAEFSSYDQGANTRLLLSTGLLDQQARLQLAPELQALFQAAEGSRDEWPKILADAARLSDGRLHIEAVAKSMKSVKESLEKEVDVLPMNPAPELFRPLEEQFLSVRVKTSMHDPLIAMRHPVFSSRSGAKAITPELQQMINAAVASTTAAGPHRSGIMTGVSKPSLIPKAEQPNAAASMFMPRSRNNKAATNKRLLANPGSTGRSGGVKILKLAELPQSKRPDPKQTDAQPGPTSTAPATHDGQSNSRPASAGYPAAAMQSADIRQEPVRGYASNVTHQAVHPPQQSLQEDEESAEEGELEAGEIEEDSSYAANGWHEHADRQYAHPPPQHYSPYHSPYHQHISLYHPGPYPEPYQEHQRHADAYQRSPTNHLPHHSAAHAPPHRSPIYPRTHHSPAYTAPGSNESYERSPHPDRPELGQHRPKSPHGHASAHGEDWRVYPQAQQHWQRESERQPSWQHGRNAPPVGWRDLDAPQ